jgi:hypothetical protein
MKVLGWEKLVRIHLWAGLTTARLGWLDPLPFPRISGNRNPGSLLTGIPRDGLLKKGSPNG